jgi:membrane protein
MTNGFAAGLRSLPRLAVDTVYAFYGDDCPTMAAALSFYSFFSLPALLTLLLTLLGSVSDPAQVQRAIVGQAGGLIGPQGAQQVATIIANTQQSKHALQVATTLSLLQLFLGATTAFAQLQAALNKAWGVKPDPRRNQIGVFLVKRVFSFGIVITVAFLLLVSLTLTAALAAVSDRLTARLGIPAELLEVVTALGSFALIAALFAVMFRYLPDARITWRDVRAGAIGTALLFVLGKTAIGLYLGRSDPGSVYGVAGSLAIVLIWVYYTSMIVLLGAEFTKLWARRHGRDVTPEKGAIAYVEEEHHLSSG